MNVSVWSSASMLKGMDSLWIHSTLKSTRQVHGHEIWSHSRYRLEIKYFMFPPYLKALKTYLTQTSLSSQQLVEKFFENKILEQVRQMVAGWDYNKCKVVVQMLLYLCVWQEGYCGEKYGAVTLLASYRKSDYMLHVEVLNAVNILPMDSNGNTIHLIIMVM